MSQRQPGKWIHIAYTDIQSFHVNTERRILLTVQMRTTKNARKFGGNRVM